MNELMHYCGVETCHRLTKTIVFGFSRSLSTSHTFNQRSSSTTRRTLSLLPSVVILEVPPKRGSLSTILNSFNYSFICVLPINLRWAVCEVTTVLVVFFSSRKLNFTAAYSSWELVNFPLQKNNTSTENQQRKYQRH